MGQRLARRANEREHRDELLSAYLDGQLSAGERAWLEAQLAADPALRAELEALRRTVALVRTLPPVPIPRNFILPQTMAARPRPVRLSRPRRAWAAPLLTAVTALASLVFVVVLAGDLLLSGVGGVAFAPAAQPLIETEAEVPSAALAPSPVPEEVEERAEVTVEQEVVVEEVEAEAEKAVPAATAPPMPAEAPPGVAPEATAEAEAPAEAGGYDAEMPEEGDEGVEPPAPAMGGGRSEEATAPAPTAVPLGAEEPAVAPTPSPATATAVPERDAGGAEPTPEEVAEAAPQATGEEESGESERGVPEREIAALAKLSPWRVLEVVLGLTTLGLALATVWAWRARRR